LSYQALINKNLDLAFRKIQDLAIEVTITKNSAEFDFNNGTTTTTPDLTKIVKAVIIDINKESQQYDYQERQIMFKSQDLIDITAYDTVTIDSEIWKIGTRINNSGFIYLINIYKDK